MWYYNDVMECAKLGIVQGYEDGKFHPDDAVSGVQFIVMLTRTFYNDKVEAAKKTNTSSWYAPNLAAAKSLNTPMLRDLTVNEKAMSRYDMAMALFNVLTNENKTILATDSKFQNAKASIKDRNDIPLNRKGAVPQCYALGIITGTDGGKFDGAFNHAAIVTATKVVNGKTLIETCDGNSSGKVEWTWDASSGFSTYGMTNKTGSIQYRIFTRYPEGLEECGMMGIL